MPGGTHPSTTFTASPCGSFFCRALHRHGSATKPRSKRSQKQIAVRASQLHEAHCPAQDGIAFTLVTTLTGASYSIGRKLGEGSFGSVYEATNLLTNQRLAAKVLPTQRNGNDCRRRIQAEVDALTAVNTAAMCHSLSPSPVLRLYDVAHGKDAWVLFTELATGGDVCQLIKQQRLTEGDAKAIMRVVLQALALCHEQRMVYGDIKTGNVLLRANSDVVSSWPHGEVNSLPDTIPGYITVSAASGTGPKDPAHWRSSPTSHLRTASTVATATAETCSKEPILPKQALSAGQGVGPEGLHAVLADFGSAQFLGGAIRLRNSSGTPGYSAPEMFMHNFGCEADLWSAGVLMYRLLANRMPFLEALPAGQIPSPYAVYKAVMYGTADFSTPEWEGISTEAKDLVISLLDRVPGDRPSAADALRHAWFAC